MGDFNKDLFKKTELFRDKVAKKLRNDILFKYRFQRMYKIFTEPAKVDATSRQGEVFNQLNFTGENLLQLKTIEGNIYIAPSQ